MILFECPFCSQVFSVEDEDMGEDVICPACDEIVSMPSMRPSTGYVVGEFVLKRKMTDWDFGKIYTAWQFSMQREVAIKLLDPQFADDPDVIKAFLQEARDDAKINYPHMGQIFTVGEQGGLYFYAMDNVNLEAKTNTAVFTREVIITDTENIAKQIGISFEDQQITIPAAPPSDPLPIGTPDRIEYEPDFEYEPIPESFDLSTVEDQEFFSEVGTEPFEAPAPKVATPVVVQEATDNDDLKMEEEFPVIRPRATESQPAVQEIPEEEPPKAKSPQKTTGKAIKKTKLGKGIKIPSSKAQFKVKKASSAKKKLRM